MTAIAQDQFDDQGASLRVTRVEDYGCIDAAGELDLTAVPPLLGIVEDLVARGVRVVEVDAHAVTFVDCAFLRALLQLAEELQQRAGGLRVVSPSKCVRRLVDLFEAQHLLDGPVRSDARPGAASDQP